MGCNSHIAIQYKRSKDCGWGDWAIDIAESRDYRLYAAMANVRNSFNIIPVTEPRGFPDDADDIQDRIFAVHSMTTLTPDEYYEAMKRAIDPIYHGSEGFAKEWIILKETLEMLTRHFGDGNVRLLVGFDN